MINCLPEPVQPVEDLRVGQFENAAANHNDQITIWQPVPLMAKTFPHLALDPVTIDRSFDLFLRHREADASLRGRLISDQDRQTAVSHPIITIEDPSVVFCPVEPA